ncbi:MAG: FHA domain-containing protein [Thermofilum sp.]|nr:FHA domain-containing protein [Thermofilum sp.]
MPGVLEEILGIIVAILAVAAATAASLYLLVLAPYEPIYGVIAAFLLAFFILLLYLGLMKPAAAPLPPPPRVTPAVAPPAPVAAPPPPPQETMIYIARLETRDGKIVPITSVRQVFGRKDFEKLVDPVLARAISREHFTIFYDFRAGKFFIEDRSSTNGTLLNGANIRGKGPIELREGDTISPAGVLHLTFKVGS